MGMSEGKRLQDLLAALDRFTPYGDTAVPISGISYDSRQQTTGTLFVCWSGRHHDGHDYLAEAVAKGARAGLVERVVSDVSVPQVLTSDTRRAMARVSAEFFDHPSESLTLIGVTGTNGKTTTTFLVQGLLEVMGLRTGLISTIETRIGSRSLIMPHTTPEAPELQALLARMRDAGCTHAVMEVSSHSLDLDRVLGCTFDVGVFTNLSQDHLDFHGDLDRYAAVKRRLFRDLRPGSSPNGNPRTAVINADDPFGNRMAEDLAVPVWWYSRRKRGNRPRWVHAADIQVRADGNRFTLELEGAAVPVRQPLAGPYNVENALAAGSVGLALGADLDTVAKGLASVRSVAGRFERISEGQPFTVVVDYAHTPDGLAGLLEGARQTAPGRIITVFGCGGDRDQGKRPKMGRIAVDASDYVVVTSDNPRSEDPLAIIEAVLHGVRQAQEAGSRTPVDVEPDRARAIARAIGVARPGDMVVIAGKGHETYQIFADKTSDFDDREVARSVLRQDRTE